MDMDDSQLEKLFPPGWKPFLDGALEEMDKVEKRLVEQFDREPMVDWLFTTLSGFTYHAAQKLIDRRKHSGQKRPLDEAVIFACSRIVTEQMAVYLLLKKGLVLPAATVLRGTVETVMQAILFMEHPIKAEEWFKGAQSSPSAARNTSAVAASLYNTYYDGLSKVAHPRVTATALHSVAIPTPGNEGFILFYGGWYAPRTAAITACMFLQVQLRFLRSFYDAYEKELEALGLLFRPGLVERLADVGVREIPPQFSWSTMLDMYESILADSETCFRSLPEDNEEIEAWAATLIEENDPSRNWRSLTPLSLGRRHTSGGSPSHHQHNRSYSTPKVGTSQRHLPVATHWQSAWMKRRLARPRCRDLGTS